jgi:spore coat protein A, manganese oxidase
MFEALKASEAPRKLLALAVAYVTLLGTTPAYADGSFYTAMLLNNAHWSMPITENPTLESVEIWSLMNFTDDSHPIHLHLVRFQILDRRTFEPYAYYTEGKVKYIGPAVPPDPSEAGWKDTVQAHPGMVTRIIARFEGYPGRYVWHCHILEHEDNEMMRPYEVKALG